MDKQEFIRNAGFPDVTSFLELFEKQGKIISHLPIENKKQSSDKEEETFAKQMLDGLFEEE